jgi:hypothetical protein
MVAKGCDSAFGWEGGGRCDSVNLDNNNNQFHYIVN